MNIKVLVENTSVADEYQKRHGLSLFIETSRHKILFDLGPDDAFLHNARKMQVDIAGIDTVIISHGHSDHGGGLKTFLANNDKAKIYIHEAAFEPYYNKTLFIKSYIGLDKAVKHSGRVVLTGSQCRIDEELLLFSNVRGKMLLPSNNRALLAKKGSEFMPDDFSHEQNLLITQNHLVTLLAGCSHSGIVNIMQEATRHVSAIDYAIAGFHMFNPVTRQMEHTDIIRQIAAELKKYDTKYLTCHCTGHKAFSLFKEVLGERIGYLSTGAQIEI